MSQEHKFQWVCEVDSGATHSTLFSDSETRRYLESSIEEKLHIIKEPNSVVTVKVLFCLRLWQGYKSVLGGTIGLYCEEAIWLYDVLKQHKSACLHRNERYRNIWVEFQKCGGVRISLNTKTNAASILVPQNGVDNLITQLTKDLPVIECKCRKAGLPTDLTTHDCSW